MSTDAFVKIKLNFSPKYTPWLGEIFAENQEDIELQKLTYMFT